MDAPDQLERNAGLGFGRSVAAGVEGRASRAERLPVPREVPVQIHTVGVLPRARGDAVGVQVGDDPEQHPGGGGAMYKSVGDGDTGRLVPVEATDDEDDMRATWVAEAPRDYRSAAGRSAEYDLLPQRG
jgi:hypothetical protein